MLKIHSFLQRVKKPIKKILPTNIGKCKTSMAVIAYAMVTVLFIITPDYIYGTDNKNVESYAKAEITHMDATKIVEETASEAVVRRDLLSLSSQFILYDLTTKGTLVDTVTLQTQNFIEEGKISTYLALKTKNHDSEEEIDQNEDKAAANQAEANVANEVDSSSTVEEDSQITAEAVPGTAKTTKETEEQKAEAQKVEEIKVADESKKKEQIESDKETEKDYVIDLAKSEIEILQRIVEAEATGENTKGKILVANVILNRVKAEDFPNSVEGVVFQQNGGTYQFSPIKDGRYWSVNITKDTKNAVEQVLQGEDNSQGALYFSARSKANKNSMKWFDNNLEFLFEYGGHEFFK